MRPWTNKTLGLGILGLFLVALGKSLCFIWPMLFQHIIQKGLALTSTSRSFEVWKDTSNFPPIFLKIYMFNWTNPEEFRERGKKPVFKQVGPYVFREVRQKDNITFHHENKTVSYLQRRFWYFDDELSNGSLSDVITNLDVVTVSAAHAVRYWEVNLQQTLSFLLTSTSRKIYISKTVDELLFSGYPDVLFTMSKGLIEDMPPYSRFGWFYLRNGTSDLDGHFNMETGEDDISQLGILRKWNYKDTMKFYKSPCNIIEGSAGEFWPPGRTKDDITLFSVELCRPITYEYEGTISHYGIDGYRYTIDKKTLGNSTRRRYPHEKMMFLEPTTTTEDFFSADHSGEITGSTEPTLLFNRSSKNTADDYSDEDPDVVNMGRCYCNGECTPSGLINVTACRFGAPVFISLPHFYKTDPSVLETVVGLNPNEREHSFSITLEPTTGIPLEVSARLQINVLAQSSKLVKLYKDVPKTYFPMFWFSLQVQVTEDMAYNLKTLLALPVVMLCTGVILAVVGLCLIGLVALLYLKKKQHAPTTDGATEKTVDDPSDKKTEMVYMDKVSGTEDANVRSDRCLYAKLY
ncbi:protein croquemort-like [Pseudomyrmex gracilis]|uniref:protein croquemort-like n=1 Tax=Pseudomyrmex gracilis TaxID=219809 RepID=UPI0009956F3A|nr:protein croquemort-like [Pseudomyrmex gracilis]XP_020281411.1 protein croquemort-like [Pseudomyrmex gracilis]XP_020281412.1 protein croquemort-like [Pseudomyrmex gracilis]